MSVCGWSWLKLGVDTSELSRLALNRWFGVSEQKRAERKVLALKGQQN